MHAFDPGFSLPNYVFLLFDSKINVENILTKNLLNTILPFFNDDSGRIK
jgi:hypothetical protein